jgi:hypothetical protein
MIFFKQSWRVEKHMSHFVALKECLLTFWLNGLTKAKHVKYRSSIGVSSMGVEMKSMLKNSMIQMQAQIVVDILQT